MHPPPTPDMLPDTLPSPSVGLRAESLPEMIGSKYKVLGLLGRGGTGQVYLCEHLHMRRQVAIKMLCPRTAVESGVLDRFFQEAHVLATLDHPNIVRVFDLDRESNRHYIVLEFVEGGSLAELVASSGPLPVAQAAHCIAQAARGLQHAFESGWLHRDIKPENLLLDRIGNIKILDLGIAKLLEVQSATAPTEPEDALIMGTAEYLAPEQALGNCDIRADIYSLGATFYFLLTGKPPFQEKSLSAKLLAHQMKTVPSVRELRPEVPAEVDELLASMLAKDPAQRPATPNCVAVALEHIVRPFATPPGSRHRLQAVQLPVPQHDTDSNISMEATHQAPRTQPIVPDAPPPPRSRDLRRRETPPSPVSVRNHEGAVLAMAFSADEKLLASAGGDGRVLIWGLRGGLQLREDLANEHLNTVQSLVFAPNQRLLVTSSACFDNPLWFWRFQEDDGCDDGPIMGAPAFSGTLAFSVDGKMLASAFSSQIIIWDVDGSNFRKKAVLHGNTGDIRSLAFSPDGCQIAAGADGIITTWRLGWLAGWRTPMTIPAHPGPVCHLAYSADGRYLASCSTTGVIRVWKPENRSLIGEYVDLQQPIQSLRFTPENKVLAGVADARVVLWNWFEDSARRWSLSKPRQDGTLWQSLTLSASGRYVAVGASSGAMVLVDLQATTQGDGPE